MESFDQTLKYLLQDDPADFLRFGLDDPTVRVLSPLPSGLPSRGRDIDGSYLISWGGTEPQQADVLERAVAHIEFQRRHQSWKELATDVAEAQVRLYRRENLPVLSQVWDLYGHENSPVSEVRSLPYGMAMLGMRSQCVYQRVTLRPLGWKELLARAPPVLWPLVALTRDGASEAAVREAIEAIQGRADLSAARQADHLAVLWFVAEAEDVPVQAMRAYLTEERLMESSLYKSAIEKGKAEAHVDILIRILMRWLGPPDTTLQDRLRAASDRNLLAAWLDEALFVTNAEQAGRLTEKIQKALVP
jgi:hypothetical protein